ncbi:dimethylsulfoxide reductase subunit B [Shewanella eurypsychrophilus]|uniref:Dimethylsulfoxide reductase subunit B n=1 Tax=Shewanella eurypsychrophilus TaxID=2593656 RepID=A0ABX6V0V5_9GAMM|nr:MULTISPECIES: DMSO/selenate family reductase complex B subunit [Shewanella]QFU20685.1 dimethylsulfoxide reductase subunit B [Shewanella sp. YLB-09]QFU20965.1 dimethylsulfoxide reductase subunit B [Shewanella sp. YLB-09]QPG56253.1 dimethylsulfoxide reductase subunit B [Shewanella eurypsychrophilus]
MTKATENQAFAFYFDASRCNGCKGCQVSCLDGRGLSLDRNFRRVYEYGGGTFTKNADGTMSQDAFAYYASVSCNHCEKPACTAACPTGAMHKKANGIVAVHDDICIGCNSCAEACPYDAPQLDKTRGKMTKCDGCFERLEFGLKPFCVQSCSQRALDCGTVDELQAKYGGAPGVGHIAPLPDAGITQPNLLIRGAKCSRPTGDTNGSVLNPNEV